MVDLSSKLSSLLPVNVLVAGDFMLDSYTFGDIRRISPEAPVPVLHAQKEDDRPGGAGNVVLGILALGANVVALGRVGMDNEGVMLKSLLAEKGADTSCIFAQQGYRTPVKRRLIASGQQLLRVDWEQTDELKERMEAEIIAALPDILRKVDIVAISDYAKGFLSTRLLKALIDEAAKQNIATLVDPKGIDFSRYRNATLVKPNFLEAFAAAGVADSEGLAKAAQKLLAVTQTSMLLITRSQAGISLYTKDSQEDFPAVVREVKDVTGAGDTVLAMLAVALANGLDIHDAVRLANVAAGLEIEEIGCYQVTLSALAKRILAYDSESKIFHEGHLMALKKVLHGRKYVIINLPFQNNLSSSLFRSICRLKREGQELIIYMKETLETGDFAHMLSSFNEVNYIILCKNSLFAMCNELCPSAVYEVLNDTLQKSDHFAT